MYNTYMQKVTIKDSALAFIFGCLFCQVSVGILFVFISLFCSLFNINFNADSLSNNCWGYLLCVLIMDLALFLVYFYFSKNKETNIVHKPTIKKTFFYIAITLIAFVCLSPLINLFDLLLNKLNIKQTNIPYKFDMQGFLVSIISLAILPAIFEELLFRGIIFKGLRQKGKVFAICVSALMFTLLHFSINQTIYPFVMGLLLGCIMWHENNILYTIIAHFVSNLLSLIFSYFNWWYVSTQWFYLVFAIIVFTLFLSFVIMYIVKDNKTTKEKLSNHEKIYLFSCLGIIILMWIIINVISLWKTINFLK